MATTATKSKIASPRKGRMPHPGKDPIFTSYLGLAGWAHLESVLLASLISETPLLLIGSHGTAKSYFLEQLAKTLNLEYRFYNTSLIDYDDLVGIPYPSADHSQLEYISVPTAIWDAEVVFMDEISRARPHLQNKVFPIIHEKRVQGRDLNKLRYRWAAMNPPFGLDGDNDTGYFGSEALDPALADRFGFIVEVPSWMDLNKDARQAVLADPFTRIQDFPFSFDDLLARGRKHYQALQKQSLPEIQMYLLLLLDVLAKADIHLSTRRITMLYANILANHAARLALTEIIRSRRKTLLADSTWTALEHSLPQRALGCALDMVTIRAAHLHAWKLMEASEEHTESVLLKIEDPAKRMAEALRRRASLSEETLGNTFIHMMDSLEKAHEKYAAALAFYLSTHRNVLMPYTALTVLKKYAQVNEVTCFPKKVDQPPENLQLLIRKLRSDKTEEGPGLFNRHVANVVSFAYKVHTDEEIALKAIEFFKKMYALFTTAVNNSNN